MSQTFSKGRTNNHLTWVMVDATDFATPESALSAATKIKIYGKLRSGTGTNFVSSGTGSLTNDITHVGASALGIYTIALAKADLSDASAAWYDQYIISLSATGAAYQTLVVDGGIDNSYLSDVLSYVSNLVSNLSVIASDAHSAALLGASHASDAFSQATLAASRALINQSRISDVQSALLIVQSMASDAHSAAILGASHASDAHSAALVIQSRLSDFDSRVVSDVSDILSAIAGVTATVSASDISDIASAVEAIQASRLSDILSAAVQANSRALVIQSLISDVDSQVLLNASMISDIQSAVDSQYSDLASKIGNVSVTITASDVSDIASAVAAAVGSDISDIYSLLSDLNSNFGSRVPKLVASQSLLSDVQSNLLSYLAGLSGAVSDVESQLDLTASLVSDIESQVDLNASMISDAHSAAILAASHASDAHSQAAVGSSRALLTQSRVSDIYSLLSDLHSDVTVLSGVVSDIESQIDAGVPVDASSMSDIASRVHAFAGDEPASVPGFTDGFGAKMDWMFALSRNKLTQTSAVQSLRNDADNSDIASAAVSDDGTTFIRGEFA